MTTNMVDVRFQTFLRTCFLVEVIEGLKKLGILAPWNYVRYYYQLVDFMDIGSILAWMGTSLMFFLLLSLILLVFVAECTPYANPQTFWLIIKFACISSLTAMMHSWYRHWKREVTK